MRQRIQILGREVEFELTRKSVKNINLRVKPGGMVFLSVPLNTPSSVIEEFMQANGARILNEIDRLYHVSAKVAKRNQQEETLLQNGDTIYILGTAYRLRICKSNDTCIVRDGDVINIYLPQHKDTKQAQAILEKWKDDLCRETVAAICKSVYPAFQTLDIPYPNEIRFRKMSASWGNCRPESGILTFSKNLVEIPTSCIEFVVQHEFTHFLYPDHSKEFYATLDAIAPHWRDAERLLRTYERRKKSENNRTAR